MTEEETIEKARESFLTEENTFGCAETALIVLQDAFGLPTPNDSSPAMVFNGGFAWTGNICGAITGAAMAVGRLSATRIDDHRQAKRITRSIFIHLLDDLIASDRPVNCKDIIGCDIRTSENHRAFIESGIWREICIRQIEDIIHKIYPLVDSQVWQETVSKIDMDD